MRSDHRLPWLTGGIAGVAFEGKAGVFG